MEVVDSRKNRPRTPTHPTVSEIIFSFPTFWEHYLSTWTPMPPIVSRQPFVTVHSASLLEKLNADWDIIIGLFLLLRPCI